MLLINDPIFCDPWEDVIYPVIELDMDNIQSIKLDTHHVYLVGDYFYTYLLNPSINDITPGTIVCMGGKYMIEPHTEEEQDYWHKSFIMSRKEYETRIDQGGSLEEMMRTYVNNYRRSANIIKSGNIKITPIGDIYMPELDKDDDPLERIIKLMLRHLKPVLNEHRGKFSKKHGLDNIKSALNGATKNMSILKFLAWCESFELDWELTIDNLDSDVPSPMAHMIILNNKEAYPWVEIPPETKDCFTVPLSKGEDPLKRAIKLALWLKLIDLKDYRKKSPTQHLINNMKSALKSKQKMTLPYFINWCEIIDLEFSFKVLNRADGIWYKITGYDVTTNDKEMD